MKTPQTILLNPDATPLAGGTPPAAPVVPPGFVSVAEQNTAIEKARKEEKDKLYGRISELEAALKSGIESLKIAEQEKLTLQGKLEAVGKAKSATGEVDVAKLVEEVSERAITGSQKKLQEEFASLNTKLAEISRRNQVLELETLRKTLIDQNGGSDALIVELVRGNSEDELKNSIKESKSAFDRIIAKSKPAGNPSIVNGNQANAGSPGSVPPVIPGSSSSQGGEPQGGAPGAAVNGAISTMHLSEYAKQRHALKASTVGRYVGVR